MNLVRLLGYYGCIELGEETPPFLENQWSIPEDQIVVGNEIDLIPSIDDPKYVSVGEVNFLSDNDLVIGYKSREIMRAYPLRILNYHEIVNDDINGSKVAITYCPLTGTSLIWDRMIDGVETTFGVSGQLFNANLLPYDRLTGTTWSQMLTRGVRGEYNNENL